jgi:hypothetical protein
MAAMEDRRPNAKHLATWAIAGAFLAASACLVTFLPIPHFSTSGHGLWPILWTNRLRLIAFLTPFALGLSLSLLAERQFKRGFQNNIWSDAELEPVKALVANSIWPWTSLALIVPLLVSVIFSGHSTHTSGGAFFCIALLPTQTAQRIRQLITPRIESAGGLIDWNNFKPLHSDHWGQPPVHPPA